MIAKLTFLKAPRFAPDHAVARPSWTVESDEDGGGWNAKARTLRWVEGAFCVVTSTALAAWVVTLFAIA